MSVYIVVGTDDTEVKFCEAYAGAQSALGRGLQIASDFAGRGRVDLIDTSPQEEKMSDNSIRWVFMNTTRHSVVVTFRRIDVALPSAKDPATAAPPSPVVIPPPPPDPPQTVGDLIRGMLAGPYDVTPIHIPVPYDFMDRSLPVGWTLDGKPALMGDLLDNPTNVKDPSDLTDAQKKAMVTARIRKSPGWRGIPKNSPIPWFHQGALTQIQRNTTIADFLIQAEIENIHSLREDLISGSLKTV